MKRAIRTLTEAVARCEAAGNVADVGQAYVTLQWSHLYRGDYDRVIALKDRAIQTLEQHMHLRSYVWAFATVSWASTCLGRWEEAVAEGRRALRIGEAYSDRSMISFTAWILLVAYISQGDLAQACPSQ